MKKFAWIAVLAGVCVLLACGGGKYADAKAILTDMTMTMDDFSAKMDKADSADKVVEAMNSFAASMKDLQEKAKQLEGKYPELKGMKNPPPELKPLADKLEESGKKMAGSMMKLMQYMSDPKVQEAQRKLTEAMSSQGN